MTNLFRLVLNETMEKLPTEMGENIVNFLSQTDDKLKTILRFAKVNKDGYRFVKSYVERNGKTLCPKAVENDKGFDHLCGKEKTEDDASIFRSVCLGDKFKDVTEEACLIPMLLKSKFKDPKVDAERYQYGIGFNDEEKEEVENLPWKKLYFIYNDYFAKKIFPRFLQKVQEYQKESWSEGEPRKLQPTYVLKHYWLKEGKSKNNPSLYPLIDLFFEFMINDKQIGKFKFRNWEHSYIFDKWAEMLFE